MESGGLSGPSTVLDLILANVTESTPLPKAASALHTLKTSTVVIITVVYLLGILGNVAALIFLFGSKSKPRNSKHAFMLRCLAANDLTASLGMWAQMNVAIFWKSAASTQAFCVFRVIWRIFGLGSGSVVIVMAVERWIALTRPFYYQKKVTMAWIKYSVMILWGTVLILVCLPFFGFGLYYDPARRICLKYKLATDPVDVAYAYVYIAYGSLLCTCLVLCNVAVMRALVHTKTVTTRQAILVRRISRNRDLTYSTSTTEEMAFARVMGLLCFVFVICWLPQLASVPLVQVYPDSPSCKTFLRVADILMALHFIVDPYFYILQRWPCFRSICRRTPSSRANSMKTTHELCTL